MRATQFHLHHFLLMTLLLYQFQVSSRARRLKRTSGLGLLVIDYIQLLAPELVKNQKTEQEISNISRGLKSIAKELDVPVLALSQLSRAVELREDKRQI